MLVMRGRALMLFCFTSGSACAGETLSLEYGELVPVTVRIEDYQGLVSVLFSASNGAIFEHTAVEAPVVLERDVPLDSSVSVHFDDPAIQRQSVFSFADLGAGDDVVFRPWYWITGSRWIEIAPIEAAGERDIEVDFGCGGYTGRADTAHRFTIADRCANELFNVAFSFVEGDRRFIAVHSAPLAETIIPPRIEDFDQVAQKQTIELRGVPADRRTPVLYARGTIEKQKFGMFGDERASAEENIAEVELYPFTFDTLEVSAILEGESDLLHIEDVLDPRAAMLDVAADLPAIRAVAFDGDGLGWETDAALGSADFALVQYGRPQSGPVQLEEMIRSWMVIKRPSATGAWQLPELPRELEHWRPNPDTRELSSVSYYELPGARRDAFSRIYARGQRTVYVSRLVGD
jgi:hypothetical protein